MKKLYATLAMVCIIVGSLTGTAYAKHIYHTYNTGCQIKVSGFEHWGKAASSTRDNNAACWQIQTYLVYQDSLNNLSYAEGPVEYDEYTKVVAGHHTDWQSALGRSPSISAQWRVVVR